MATRDVMRAKAALAVGFVCVVAVAVSAAYLVLVTPPEDTTRFVPGEAQTVVHVNATALAGDDTTDRLFGRVSGTDDGYEALLASIEDETGLDTDELHEATAFFGRDNGADPQSEVATGYAAVVFRTDQKSDEIREGVRRFSVEESSYNGVPFYAVRLNDTSATEGTRPFYATAAGRGVYVVGTEDAVRDASDVAWGNAEPLGDGSRDELGDASVSFVAPNVSVLTDVSTVSGEYRTRANRTVVAVELHPDETSQVGEVRRTVNSYIGAAQILGDERAAAVLGDVEVTETNSSVVVEHGGSVNRTAEAVRVLEARFGWGDRLRTRLDALGMSFLFDSERGDDNVTEPSPADAVGS
ncbi:MAG: hypothetical protein ACLFR5_03635 [Halobacteriales archaeon]